MYIITKDDSNSILINSINNLINDIKSSDKILKYIHFFETGNNSQMRRIQYQDDPSLVFTGFSMFDNVDPSLNLNLDLIIHYIPFSEIGFVNSSAIKCFEIMVTTSKGQQLSQKFCNQYVLRLTLDNQNFKLVLL